MEYVNMWKAIDKNIDYVREKYILPSDDISDLQDKVFTRHACLATWKGGRIQFL